MICFDTRLTRQDSGSGDGDAEKNDDDIRHLRNRLRGVYYYLRYIFVDDELLPLDNISVPPDSDYKKEHADDQLTLHVAETKAEGVRDVLNNMMQVIEACLSEAPYNKMRKETNGALDIALAISLYGINLVGLEEGLLDEDYWNYVRSFDTLHSLTESRNQAYERTLQFNNSNKANMISRRGLILTTIGIWVSFLAGSILCDVITGEHATPEFQAYVLVITGLSAVLIVAAIVAVYLNERKERGDDKKNDDDQRWDIKEGSS